MNNRQTNVDVKIKQSRLKTNFTKRPKPIAIYISFLRLKILVNFDNIFNLNQAYIIVIKFFSYKMTDIYLIICKKEKLLDLIRLNILCILTKLYNKNQDNNIFY